MSSNYNLNVDDFVELRQVKSLLEAFDYILKSNNIPSDEQKLINLELDIKQYPSKLGDLAKTSADSYGIDLQIIAYTNEKFEIINKDWLINTKKLEKQAFLVFNSDYTISEPLSVLDTEGEKLNHFRY